MTSRVDNLSQQAETWYKNMSDFVFKHSTFQLIVLGWIVSAEGQIASANQLTHSILAATILGYSAFTSGIYHELRGKSLYVFSRLQELDKDVAEDCIRFQISLKFLLSAILVHFAVSFVSVWLIFEVSHNG